MFKGGSMFNISLNLVIKPVLSKQGSTHTLENHAINPLKGNPCPCWQKPFRPLLDSELGTILNPVLN